MLSHNNLQEQVKKNEPKKQRFAIKKLTVGVASVLLGVTFAGTASANTADANSNSDSANSDAEQTDHTLTLTSANNATMKQATAAHAESAQPAVVNEAGNIKTPVASGYEDAVNKAVDNAMNNASAAMANNDNQQMKDDSAREIQAPKTETFVPTTTPAVDNAISTVLAQKVQTPASTNDNVNQTYSIKVTAIDDTTGKAPVTSNYGFNFNFKNGVYFEKIQNGKNTYSFGTAPTGYKLLNPEALKGNFIMDGNMAKVNGKDVDITLHYAPISPIMIKYIDEDSNEVLSTSSVGANTSSTASLAYIKGDKTAIGPSKFMVSAIDIPGYQLDDEQEKVQEYTNIQSKGNLNYQTVIFKYKKIMNNQNPKDSQKGSGVKYGEYFGPEWSTIDPADVFTTSGVQGYKYKNEQNGDVEAKTNAVINKYKNQGYTYVGTFNYHRNDDYYNWNEASTALNLIPNKAVTVQFIDQKGNKLAANETIAFNHDNPDQTNEGINPAKHWYSKGTWHATPKTFDGYTLRTTYGATEGQFTPYAYVVTFEYAKDITGQVKYIDDDNKGKVLQDDALKGYVGDKINYSTADSIAHYEGQGYELVSDGFTHSDQTFADASNIFEVHFKHGQTPVNPQHPWKGIDPSNYTKDVHETVHYTGAGTKTPDKNVQNSQWAKTITVDKVTNEIISHGQYDTDWAIVDGQKTNYDQVDTPVIDGYHADKANVPSTAVTQDNIDVTVNYSPNGKIIPVDPQGNKIPDAPQPQYPTDPNDPTSVTPDEKVPEVPGYVPTVPTVTPDDPGKDTKVVYNQNQKADLTIVDQDNGGKQITVNGVDTKFNNSGIHNTKISFDGVDSAIAALEAMGYEYVDSTFKDGAVFDNDGKTDQHFTITMKHGTQPVNPQNPGKPGEPINPNDPTGPKFPADSGQVTKDVTRTIQYVDGNGNPVSKSVKQPVHFTAEGVLDKVTGEWITPITWTGDGNLAGAKTPVVDGYHVTHVSRDSKDNVNVDSTVVNHETDSYTVTVNYGQNGKIIPVDPEGNPIPNAPTPTYPTGPTDPTTVTPNEPVPSIPGYTPDVPTVTPQNPGVDTHVVYHKNTVPTKPAADQNAIVNYIDQDNNGAKITTSGNLSGKAGQKIDYSTASTIAELEGQGYELVSDGFPANATFDDNDNTTQTFTVVLKHGHQPVNPQNPGKPGEPINPNDPNGPKYPAGSDQVTKDVTRTIHYVDNNGNNLENPVDQTAHFEGNGVIDKVTGQWITPITWTGNGNLNGAKTPVVDGYHVTSVSRDSKDNVNVDPITVDHNTDNYDVNVTYSQNGKIVPVDPNGNVIPGVPTPTYKTDPNDPSKVIPNEPVPEIPGMTPEVTTVTPQNPGEDTQVVYNVPTPVTPETPVQPAPAAPKAETPAPVKEAPAQPAVKAEAKKLPQTGNQTSDSAAALGLAALGLTGMLAAGKKRRKED